MPDDDERLSKLIIKLALGGAVSCVVIVAVYVAVFVLAGVTHSGHHQRKESRGPLPQGGHLRA